MISYLTLLFALCLILAGHTQGQILAYAPAGVQTWTPGFAVLSTTGEHSPGELAESRLLSEKSIMGLTTGQAMEDNLVQMEAEVRTSGSYYVELSDMAGRVLETFHLSALYGHMSSYLDIASLTPGAYVVLVSNCNTAWTERSIVIKPPLNS